MKCEKCGKPLKKYYFDAGDHFGAGRAPNSGWRFETCECRIQKEVIPNCLKKLKCK